eukprot:Gb_26143 [translate_table: standard]
MDSFHVISVKSEAIHGGSKSITIPIVRLKNCSQDTSEPRKTDPLCQQFAIIIPFPLLAWIVFNLQKKENLRCLSLLWPVNSGVSSRCGFTISIIAQNLYFYHLTVVNHGVAQSLMDRMRGVIREFFEVPSEEKKQYAVNPGSSSQGYGQLFMASDDQVLDWADMIHFFCLPTLAISPYLLQDEGIEGLHIRKNGEWIPVQPIPSALVINIGDMLEAYRVKFTVFPPVTPM